MSEENVVVEDESLIDSVFSGGDENVNHSPEAENKAEASPESKAPESTAEAEEVFDPYGDDDDTAETFDDDSAKEGKTEEEKTEQEAPALSDSADGKGEKAPEASEADHAKEIANLNKRLHDTQAAMHKATAKAAELQKKLEALEQKKAKAENTDDDADDEEDDWFSDPDEKEVDALKKELSEIQQDNKDLESQQQELQQQANLAAWHQAAASVRAAHADFDELVYDKLEPLLDPENGDARIRELYMQQKDRTPAGAYKFAKSLPMILEILENPEAFHAKMHSFEEKVNQAPLKVDSTRKNNKAALDMVNSAEFADNSKTASVSLVDAVFG
jgi:DNA repair exonuclease SbcCD ATPase subunit